MTKAPTFYEVSRRLQTDMDSIKKKQVDATMAMDTIQKEIATYSFGFRKPCKSTGMDVLATMVVTKCLH